MGARYSCNYCTGSTCLLVLRRKGQVVIIITIIIIIIIFIYTAQIQCTFSNAPNNINPLQFSNQIYNSFIKSNQIKCWFLRRGENRSTRRKTSRSRVENKQTRPTYDAESGNRTRDTLVEGERSHHCANPASPNKTRDNLRSSSDAVLFMSRT